jgi:hypothetical protein
MQTLGEYPTTISRIRLTHRGSGHVVWDLAASSGTPQIHTLDLRPGLNQSVIGGVASGTYEILVPRGGGPFQLEAGAEYAIEVWGAPGSRSSHAVFTVGAE